MAKSCWQCFDPIQQYCKCGKPLCTRCFVRGEGFCDFCIKEKAEKAKKPAPTVEQLHNDIDNCIGMCNKLMEGINSINAELKDPNTTEERKKQIGEWAKGFNRRWKAYAEAEKASNQES